MFEFFYQQYRNTNSTVFDQNLCDQNELMFRFILARNVRPFKIVKLLHRAMELQMHKLSKAFSWYLLRCMIHEKNSSISKYFCQVKDIWPGFFCRCSKRKKGHEAICSKEPVIVIDADEYLEGLQKVIYGIPIVQSAYYLTTESIKDKREALFEDKYNCKNMPTLSGENAQKLFTRHTKLTLLYISINPSWCVRLCCQAKGIIPMGEPHLPVEVCSTKTEVMHGNVSFLHKMHVGNKIGPSTQTSWGTLGGFVQRKGRDAFLTCSHVVYDRKLLLCGNKRNKNKEEVKVKCYLNGNGNDFICGYVIHDLFEYDNKYKTSIDAAVVVLDRKLSSIDKDEIVQIIDTYGNQSSHPAAFLGIYFSMY